MNFLGIDLGTSGVKVLLIDEAEHVIEQAVSSLEVSRPRDLWSEQSPSAWWQAVNDAVLSIKSRNPNALSACKAIGLSGQMHGATLLDQANNVIRPAILWNDGRSIAECKELEAQVSNCRQITGNIVVPGFTAPKILWLKKHEADAYKKIHKVLLPKDYIRFMLTGDFVSDVSDSSGTYWLNVEKRAWSSDLLEACGLNVSHMPEALEGTAITGKLSKSVARAWGMDQVSVVAGGGDNAAGAVATGVVKAGSAFLSLGTSGVYFVSNASYQPNTERAVHTFCHCIPETWHQMSVTLSAASCLSWLSKILGVNDETSLLTELNGAELRKENEIIFLPYLSGERTPHNNPYVKGGFYGLAHDTERKDLIRAVLEGVAFAFADGQEALQQSGMDVSDVTVIGGGSKSHEWGRILASVLNKPLSYRINSDLGPAFGAARLAKIAHLELDPLSACKAPEISRIVVPDDELVARFQQKRKKFQTFYQSLSPLY